ncbi:phage tail length tape measure family protein [Mannheimia pernigra]|uniref:Phage tail length tape measure family protein n=1 Tax=Mannheimia pernigra TaxID=111844 RepID=A0A7D5HTH9_9PAST|nr:phage tail length tape measure family protein [Mannheimia pernigra]QLB40789.1 phage tail length tape measure family protein [Mannheimia pernigra]
MTVEVGGVVITADLEFENLLRDVQKVDKAMDDIGKSTLKAEKGLKGLETQATKTAKEVEEATKKMKKIGYKVGQFGLQVQDITVALQMGSNLSTVVAQQGSHILSIFGPMGAVAGAILAIGSAIGGALLPNLLSSADAVEQLKVAMADLDKVIKFSENGIAALSNEYAYLMKSNKELAEHMKQAAINKFEFDVRNAKDAIRDLVKEQSSFISSFGSNGATSVSQMGTALKQLGIDTNSYGEAMKQASKEGDLFAWHIDTIQNTTEMLAEKFGLSEDAAFQFGKKLSELGENPTPEKINEFANFLKTLESNTESGKEEINKFTQKLLESGAAISKITYLLSGLNAQLGDVRTIQQENAIQGMLKAAETEVALLGKSVREKKKYLAEQVGMTAEELKNYDVLLAKKEAHDKAEEERKKAEAEAKKKSDEAKRKALQAAKKAEAEAKRIAEREVKSLEKAESQVQKLAEQYKIAILQKQGMSRDAAILETRLNILSGATDAHKKQVQDQAGAFYEAVLAAEKYAGAMYDLSAMDELNSLMMDVSPTLQLDIDKAAQDQKIADGIKAYQNQITMIDQAVAQMQSKPLTIDAEKQLSELTTAKETYLSVIASAEEMRSQLEEQYRQQRMEAQWEEWKQASDGARMFGDAVDAVGSSATSTITGLLNGTMSVRDAFASIANTILNSVVQSLVEMGMAQVKQMIMGQAVAKASMAAQMVQAKALAAAFAPAASMVSLATQGANAVPAQAAITSTMGVAQMAAVTGRKVGGPVSANQMYRVGENNQPEIFKASNGMQYMIPGQGGRVFSNKQSQNRRGDESKHLTVVVNQTNHFSSDDVNSNQVGLAKLLGEQVKSAVRVELQTQMRAGGILSR